MSKEQALPPNPLVSEELRLIDAWWRACNYLSVGMIYLRDNPLLEERLKLEHVKHRLLGHWGASPALSFVWAHLNRVIKRDDLDMIFIAGPGHGAPGVLGPAYLEGTLLGDLSGQERGRGGDAEVLQAVLLSRATSAHMSRPRPPGRSTKAASSATACRMPMAPRSTTPSSSSRCVVGDGEAETGPLATAWHSNKFINPVRDGAVLPILNLNGYKIANPTILARISHEELEALFVGYGYKPYFVEGSDPAEMHQKMAAYPRRGFRRDPRHPGEGARERQGRAAALADDRAALTQGLDWSQGDRRPQGGGLVALAPGAVLRRARQSRESASFSRPGCEATSPRSCSTQAAGCSPS